MGLRIVALTALAALAAVAPAQAETFTVTTTADPVGVASCTPTLCTVRTAITAAGANGTAADDVIVMPAGVYAVTAQLGALTVPSNATRITFQGAGANSTSIEPPVGTRALVIGTNAGATLTGLTLRGGTLASGQGGNLQVQSGASLNLNRARITGGTAPQGGGIGALGAASLTIQSSLIDNNFTTGADITNSGGGLYVQGQTTATAITIQDSTIEGNGARNGGGIAVDNNTGEPVVLRGVTLTRNTARAGTPTGIGGIYTQSAGMRFQGSIVAGNLTTINLGGGPAVVAANCSQAATDDGGNVSPDADDQCGLGGVHTDPQLAGALDNSQPPALPIPANSSALNVAACGARTTDQRGVARPQGTLCDAGAYEYDGAAPETTLTPVASPAGATPTFTFASSEPGATFQCRIDGAPFAACVSPFTTPALGDGTHTFEVRAVDVAGNADPTPAAQTFSVGAPPVVVQQPTPTPTATPTPAPQGVRVVSGTVRIKVGGKFVPFDPALVKNGTEIDTREGVVEITSGLDSARFYDGIFKLSRTGGLTTLTLTEKLDCPKRGAKTAVAAAKKPKTRKLWGDGKGRFRTKGTYSAATVRGTKWLVQDTCTSTLTRVTQGVVTVQDFAKHKSVIVRKGKRYTARAKRRS
jgi:hypothetical protein